MDIADVARRARVSTATVSRVLNHPAKVRPATLERVQRIIEALQYVPNTSARSLRKGRTQLFGIIVSDINNPFFPDLIDAFEGCAQQHGNDVVFTHTGYDPERLARCVQRLLERNVDGVAICTSESSPAAFEQLQRSGKPFVLMNQAGRRAPYPNVYVDHHHGAREAIDHLHSLGHRRIGFISGPAEFNSTRLRREAFHAAMQRRELEVRSEWIVEGDLHMTGGHAAMEQILRSRRAPSALLCTNDLMAFGALQCAHQHGIDVPRDLSIIGFDNLPICDMVTPPLTSVEIPRREIAMEAFRILNKAAEATTAPARSTVTARLVLRSSTAPAPGM